MPLFGFRNLLRRFGRQIGAINRKYATPHIKTTPLVTISLLMLRAYLVVLVAILVYKFISLVR